MGIARLASHNRKVDFFSDFFFYFIRLLLGKKR